VDVSNEKIFQELIAQKQISLKSQYKLEAQIKDLKRSFEERADKTDLIIFGNEAAGIKGLSKKVEDHEKYIETDRKQKWIGRGILLTIVLFGKFLGAKLLLFIKAFI
jgi:hypothetical protein